MTKPVLTTNASYGDNLGKLAVLNIKAVLAHAYPGVPFEVVGGYLDEGAGIIWVGGHGIPGRQEVRAKVAEFSQKEGYVSGIYGRLPHISLYYADPMMLAHYKHLTPLPHGLNGPDHAVASAKNLKAHLDKMFPGTTFQVKGGTVDMHSDAWVEWLRYGDEGPDYKQAYKEAMQFHTQRPAHAPERTDWDVEFNRIFGGFSLLSLQPMWTHEPKPDASEEVAPKSPHMR